MHLIRRIKGSEPKTGLSSNNGKNETEGDRTGKLFFSAYSPVAVQNETCQKKVTAV